MKRSLRLLGIAILWLTTSHAQNAIKTELGIQVGLLSGIDFRYAITERWGVGLQAGGIAIDLGGIRQNIAEQPTLIDLDASWFSAGITLDRTLGTPKVRLKTGLFYCIQGDFNYRIVPDRSFTIAGITYEPEDLGHVTMAFSPTRIQPYLGLDFRFPIGKRLLLGGAVGAWYLHRFTPELSSSGFLSFRADAMPFLQRNLDTYRVFPQIALSLHVQL